MNKPINEWMIMNESMNWRMIELIKESMKNWMNEKFNELMNEEFNEWMNEEFN